MRLCGGEDGLDLEGEERIRPRCVYREVRIEWLQVDQAGKR